MDWTPLVRITALSADSITLQWNFSALGLEPLKSVNRRAVDDLFRSKFREKSEKRGGGTNRKSDVAPATSTPRASA